MTPSESLTAFAWALRGFQGMGLIPSPSEDSGGPWERLAPELRDKWLGYAAQVLHSATALELSPVEAEPTGRELVFEGIAATPTGQVVAVRRYADGTSDSAPLPKLLGCQRCGGVFTNRDGEREAHERHCPGLETKPVTSWDRLRAAAGVVRGVPADAVLDCAVGVEPACTGVAARWCSVHGDCRCRTDDNGERLEEADDCPLHGASSTHGDDGAEALSEQFEREKREAAIVAAVERVIGSEAAGGRQPVCQMCRKRWSEVKLAPCTSPWRRNAPPFRDGDHQWEFEDVRGDE